MCLQKSLEQYSECLWSLWQQILNFETVLHAQRNQWRRPETEEKNQRSVNFCGKPPLIDRSQGWENVRKWRQDERVRKWRQLFLVCCGQKNVNRIMPDFEQNKGTNLKQKSASRSGTERSEILNNGSTQHIKTLFKEGFSLVACNWCYTALCQFSKVIRA